MLDHSKKENKYITKVPVLKLLLFFSHRKLLIAIFPAAKRQATFETSFDHVKQRVRYDVFKMYKCAHYISAHAFPVWMASGQASSPYTVLMI
jgi:hypothetical protein